MSIELNGAVDPAAALKMYEEFSTNPDAELPAAEKSVEAPQAEPKQQAEAAPAQNDAAVGTTEQEPAGVATKDGKHVIPYSVLKSERERAAQAEQQLREQLDRIAELERQVQAGQQQGAKTGESARTEPPKTTEAADISDEDMAFIEEEFPTVAKAIKAALKRAEALEAKLQPVEERLQSEAETARQQRAMTVQEAIDATPKLAHLQASDPDTFAIAQQFDNVLRNNPAWAHKPLQERFAKVIDMVEASNGPIVVPGQTPPAKETPEAKREAAAAAAAQQAKQAAVPTSLSQFPAGDPVATDEVGALEKMSHQDIAGKLARMSPEKQLEFLANL